VSDSYAVEKPKLHSKLQAALKNNGKEAPIIEYINGWTIDDINQVFNGADAFRAIYTLEPSRNPGSGPNNLGKNLTLYANFEQLSGNRHLTRGIQNYVKWTTGLTLNTRLRDKEQAGNLNAVKENVSKCVKRALEREKVDSAALSGNVDGVLLDPAIWKYATSQSLVTLQGTRSGTRGVGRALAARQRVQELASELQRYYMQSGTTLAFIKKFCVKELNYQDHNVLNGWYAPNKQPANGAEMRPIMMALDPAVLIDSDRARANTLFIQNAVKLQLKERPPSELTGVAAVLWKYASDVSSMDARNGGPNDHATDWFFEKFVTQNTQANLGKAMSLYAEQNNKDWTKLPATRTTAKANNGLSIATALSAADRGRGNTNPPQAQRVNDEIPKLGPEEQKVVKFFELGVLERCKDKSGRPIAGQLTFSNAPKGRCFTKKELPALLEGFAYQRFVERLRPVEQSLNAPLTYGGNMQDFSLGIFAPSISLKYAQTNWFVEMLTKAVFQPGVVGWDYLKFTAAPAFAAFRWTPGAAEIGAMRPRRQQVVDICVEMDEFRRIKKAVGARLEVHIDAAWDFQRMRPQFFMRGEGNVKASALGVLWQISRAWLHFRERPRGRGGADGANGRGGSEASGRGGSEPDGRGGSEAGGSGGSEAGGRGGSEAGGSGGGGGSEADGSRGGGEDHPGWWDKLKSYADISKAVRRMSEERREAAIEEGAEYMRTIQRRMLRQVRMLAAKTGDYAEAEALGLKAEMGVDVPAEYSNLARECSNVTLEAKVTGGEGEQAWRITLPLLVKLPDRGLLSMDPRVEDMMHKVGLPEKAFENLHHSMSDEEQEQISKLKPGVRFYVQIFKAIEGAVFANFNFTPGVAYAGLYLDVGFVLPIVVLNRPLGRGGATSSARTSVSAVLPLWVRGKSIQVYGNRNEKVATAGIVIR
jgi:hypothetical protein